MHPALTKMSTLCLLPILLFTCTTITPPPTTQFTPPEKMITKIFQPLYHDAPAMAIMLHELYGITAVADSRTNIVIVHATKVECEEAFDLVRDLDKTNTENPIIYIYPIKNMKAADLAVTLQAMMDKRYFNQDDPPDTPTPALVVYEPLNELIVKATFKAEPVVRNIIKQLDRKAPNPSIIPE